MGPMCARDIGMAVGSTVLNVYPPTAHPPKPEHRPAVPASKAPIPTTAASTRLTQARPADSSPLLDGIHPPFTSLRSRSAVAVVRHGGPTLPQPTPTSLTIAATLYRPPRARKHRSLPEDVFTRVRSTDDSMVEAE